MRLDRFLARLAPILEANPNAKIRFHTAHATNLEVLSVYAENAPGSAGIAGVPWPAVDYVEIDIGRTKSELS